MVFLGSKGYRLYSGLFVLLRLKVRVDIREVVGRALFPVHRHLLSQVMSEAQGCRDCPVSYQEPGIFQAWLLKFWLL